MARVQRERIAQRDDARHRCIQRLAIAIFDCRVADGAGKETVATEHHVIGVERDVPGRVSGDVHHRQRLRSHGDSIAFRQLAIREWRLLDDEPIAKRRVHRALVQGLLERMHVHRHRMLAQHAGERAEMIEVRVREPDAFERRAGRM